MKKGRASCEPDASLNLLRDEVEFLRRRNDAQRARIRRIDDQLRLAGRLQRNLRPTVPAAQGLDIYTISHPAEEVGGDLYDIVRLDESHIAVALADVTGHDLAAGMLAVFLRRSLRAFDAPGCGRSLPDPADILARANRDILNAELQDCHFATAIYAVYDERTRVIRWARAGAPYPILVRPGDRPEQLRSDGPLLGAIPDVQFEVREHQLRSGESLLFHTDGLEESLLGPDRAPGCCDLPNTPWFADLSKVPLGEHLRSFEAALPAGRATGSDRDDVTVVALHVPKNRAIDPDEPVEAVRTSRSLATC